MNKSAISSIIGRYILPFGISIFLCGLCLFESRSGYHSLLYLLVSLPALIICILKPSVLQQAIKSNAFKLVCLLCTMAMISTLWNGIDGSSSRYIRYSLNILLFILAFIYTQHYTQNMLEKLLLLGCAVWAISGVIELYHFYYEQGHAISTRVVGSGSLTNTLLSSHIYGALASFLAAYLVAKKHSTSSNSLIIIGFLLLLTFIIQTHSRTPLLGLTAACTFLLIQYRNKKIIYGSTFLMTLLAVYIVFNIDLITQRGFSYRPEIWQQALNDIYNKPVLGHGLGSKMALYITSIKVTFSDSHNIHIGLTYDFGLIGLITWLALLGTLALFFKNNKHITLVSTGFAMLIFGIFAGMTEGAGFFTRPKEVWFLIWLPIAILIAMDVRTAVTHKP